MENEKFSKFYGVPAKKWAKTPEGKTFAKYLKDTVEQKGYSGLNEQERNCYDDYLRFDYVEQFKELYDKPAPWKNEPLGAKFRNYLESAEENDIKLSEKEKKCLKDLKAWKKENPDEAKDLETDLSYNLDSMRWCDITTPSDVAYYLGCAFFPSKENKNTANYVENKWLEGMSIGKIADEAKTRYEAQCRGYSSQKEQDKQELEDKSILSRMAIHAQHGLRKETPINFADKAKIWIIIRSNKNYEENNKNTSAQNHQLLEDDEQLKTDEIAGLTTQGQAASQSQIDTVNTKSQNINADETRKTENEDELQSGM